MAIQPKPQVQQATWKQTSDSGCLRKAKLYAMVGEFSIWPTFAPDRQTCSGCAP